jgi:hypothetical protein
VGLDLRINALMVTVEHFYQFCASRFWIGENLKQVCALLASRAQVIVGKGSRFEAIGAQREEGFRI